MNAARSFDAAVLPLLDAAYNLARWLLKDDQTAEDAVQESCLRALRYYKSLRGDDARPWFLAIVRNVCFTYLEGRRNRNEVGGLEAHELEELQFEVGLVATGPEAVVRQRRDRVHIDDALRALAPVLREVIVLRELEGMNYEDIARVVSIPIGTVMSRLSRGRAQLRKLLTLAGAGN